MVLDRDGPNSETPNKGTMKIVKEHQLEKLDPKWEKTTVIWTKIEEDPHFSYDDLKEAFAVKPVASKVETIVDAGVLASTAK